jgi:hypothetical protein
MENVIVILTSSRPAIAGCAGFFPPDKGGLRGVDGTFPNPNPSPALPLGGEGVVCDRAAFGTDYSYGILRF